VESSVESTGKVGVIVPHGVLFRGSSEGKIRQQFIEENILEAVVGLPANLFFGTGIPAAILIFNRNKKNQDVIFIDASREYLEGKNQNKLRLQDIEKIVNTFNKAQITRQAGVILEKYAYRATIKEIEENDYNLNIPRYVDTFEEEEEVDIEAVQKEIKGLNSKLTHLESEMKSYLDELGYQS
jgi:type I restriction enzyme M protein